MSSTDDTIVIPVTTDAAKAAQLFDQLADKIERSVKLGTAMNEALSKTGDIAKIAAYREEADELNSTLETVGKSAESVNDTVEEAGRVFGASSRVIQEAGTTVGRLGAELGGLGAYRGVIDTITRSLFMMGSTIVGGADIAIAGGVVGAVGAMSLAFGASVGSLDEVAKRISTVSMRMEDFNERVKKIRAESMASAATAHEDAVFRDRSSVGDYKSSEELAADQLAQRQATSDEYMQRINAISGSTGTYDKAAADRASNRSNAEDEDMGWIHKAFLPFTSVFETMYAGHIKAPGEGTTDNGVSVENQKTDLFQQMEDHLRAIDAHFAGLGVGNAISANEADTAEFAHLYDMEKGSIKKYKKPARHRPELGEDVFDDQMIGPLAEQDERQKRENLAQHDQTEWANAVAQKQSDDAIKLAEKEAEAKKEIWEKSIRQNEEAQKKSMAVMHNLANQGASMLAGAFTKMATAAVEGHKIQLKSILQGLGEQAIAQGTIAMFKGIIDLASLNPAGAVELATGAAELAFGLGLAGASSSGGGSAPSASAASFTNPNVNAFGDPVSSPNNTTQKTGPTIIYIDMPSVISPSADDGMRIRQALQDATHVYGPPV